MIEDNLEVLIMKRTILLSASVLLMPLLVSCTTDEDDYKNPELFITQVEGARNFFETSKDGDEKRLEDKNYIVLNELKKINEYERVSKINDESKAYFRYEHILPANSGPNIARMTVFENGYLEIYRKQSLGFGHNFYYKIDTELAASLNRFVEERITYVTEAHEEALKNAQEYVTMDNFLAAAATQSNINSICYFDTDWYDFSANQDVVNKMKEYSYTLVDENKQFEEGRCFEYNTNFGSLDYFKWSYQLDSTKGEVTIKYLYSYAEYYDDYVNAHYSMDKSDANELFEYIKSIAIKK